MRTFGKYGCQKLVAMETSKLVITWYKYQNIPRRFLGKFARFNGENFILYEVIHLQIWRGSQTPISSGLNEVKSYTEDFSNKPPCASVLIPHRGNNISPFESHSAMNVLWTKDFSAYYRNLMIFQQKSLQYPNTSNSLTVNSKGVKILIFRFILLFLSLH